MKRAEWRRKSQRFGESARVLLNSGEYGSAYYLAGLSVECALKAKISGRFSASAIPEKTLVEEIYRNGHNLEKLVTIAQIQNDLTTECLASPNFNANWQIVRQWKVDARYKDWSHAEANDMVGAVTARGNGVLAWIRRIW